MNIQNVNHLVHAYKVSPWRVQRQWIGTALLAVVALAMVATLYLDVTSQAAIAGREIQDLTALITALVIDQIFDNLISPRILSAALKVHPAAVLVAAIVAANLFGILGVVVAAPILATATLLWKYIMRKMLDINPWPENEVTQPPPPPAGRFLVSIRRFFRSLSLNRNKGN